MKAYLPIVAALSAGLACSALAEPGSQNQQRITTVTRLVQEFLTLENDLATALQKDESTVISKIVSDDFELRTGAMPGIPTPRADWLNRSRGNLISPFYFEQMAVHDYGTTAVVSFLWKQRLNRDNFIVDVWTKSGDTWILSVRYSSPVEKHKFPIPDATSKKTIIEKKY